MRYEERPPTPALAHVVECFWLLTSDAGPRLGPAAPPAFEQVLPDGCPELILNRADPFTAPAGAPDPEVPVGFAGQLRRSIRLGTPERLDVLGVRFLPAGASALLGPAVDELTDRFVPVADLDPGLGRDLELELELRGDASARIRRIEARLLARLRPPARADRVVGRAVERLVATRGALRVEELAAELGITARHLGRLFTPRVGLGPKRLARILRFQSVFQALDAGPRRGWVEVALRAGYSDQAHLIHDFRELAGETPPALLDAAGDLTHCFTRSGRPGS